MSTRFFPKELRKPGALVNESKIIFLVDALALIPPYIGSFSMLDALLLNYFMGGPAFGSENPPLITGEVCSVVFWCFYE